MNIDELEEFTIGESAALSIEELELAVSELSEKLLNDNRELPPSIIVKLQEICAPLPGEAPKLKEGTTNSGLCLFLTLLLAYLKDLPDISEKWAPILQSVIDAIFDYFL